MAKFTLTNEKQVREFMEKMDDFGVVTVDQWTSGSGRYTSNKAIPPFVSRCERKEYCQCDRPSHGTVERTAYEWFERNPRRKACLVLDKEALFDFLFCNSRGKEV